MSPKRLIPANYLLTALLVEHHDGFDAHILALKPTTQHESYTPYVTGDYRSTLISAATTYPANIFKPHTFFKENCDGIKVKEQTIDEYRKPNFIFVVENSEQLNKIEICPYNYVCGKIAEIKIYPSCRPTLQMIKLYKLEYIC